MKYFKQYLFSLLLLLFVSSCETNLDLLDDPNSVTPSTADLNLLLNSSQVSFNDLFDATSFPSTINYATMEYTRMIYQFGVYVSGPTTFDRVWYDFYASFLVDNRILIERAEAEDGYSRHAGMAQVLEAFATVTMVDFFGDIPYSEAAQGTDFINPLEDADEDIYAEMFVLLDTAIANLTEENSFPVLNDIYYDGNVENWIRLANTIKLKMYIQTKDVNPTVSKNKINSLLAEDMLISSSNQDFQFDYGTSVSAPDTRHPLFPDNYGSGGSADYMSNSYMYELKSKDDPRFRYYFFRQTTIDPTGAFLVCTPNPPEEFCYIGDAYWGRDHGTTSGLPADGTLRTTFGIYPIGGEFDKDTPHDALAESGLQGAGLNPIMLASFVNFLRAEAALTIPGVTGDPATLLETAISQSITKVMSYGSGQDLGGLQPTTTEIADFKASIMAEYANAGSNDEKLEVIMRQYWVAAFGNGKEIYDAYRRTGHPDLQTPLELPAIFPRLNLYPSAYVSANDNAVQRQITEQVFWDTNPANFID